MVLVRLKTLLSKLLMVSATDQEPRSRYFLNGFGQSQEEIEKFIKKCKESENTKGYLSQSFFQLCKNSNYQFTSGPFSEKIFKIINLQKNKINILLGNIKTTIENKELSFTPL